MRKYSHYAAAGLVTCAVVAVSFILFRPTPAALRVTPRAGDDTVVVNQMHPTRLGVLVLDQYGRRFHSDSGLRYAQIAGDSMRLSASGEAERE